MATLTFVGSTTQSFGASAAWSPAQVPTTADLCIFASSSATCSINTTSLVCGGIDFTTYNKRIAFGTNGLAVYGNITLGTQMGFTFASTAAYNGYNLVMATGGSLTTNGMTMGVPFGFYNTAGSNITYTITDYLNCSENFSTGANNPNTHTINGGTISLYKNFGINIGSNTSTTLTTGTSNIVMLGTGTIVTTANTNGGLANNFTINPTATVTLPTTLYYRTGTLTIAGTPTFTNTGTLAVTGTMNYLSASSSSSYLIPFTISIGASTLTLLSDIYQRGGLGMAGSTINGNNLYIYSGSITNTGTSGGTTVLRLSGTSSSSTITNLSGTTINNNIVINTPGTVTINSLQFGGSTFTYTAGNVTILNTFTPATLTAQTFTMPSSKFLTVAFGIANATYTLLSDWNISTITNTAVNMTFTGSNIWTTDIKLKDSVKKVKKTLLKKHQ